MKHYAIYEPSGRIVQSGYCNPSSFSGTRDRLSGDFSICEAYRPVSVRSDFVQGGAVHERQFLDISPPAAIIADGQDEAVITGIPAGVSVTWPDGQTDEVLEGEVRFSVDLPGTYILRFSAVEYLDQEVAIEAQLPD